MKELVEYIAAGLVDEPDAVEVIEDGDDLELRVSEEDRGKIIGRRGRTAHAIRTVLTAFAPKGHTPSLDIVD